MKFQVYLFLLFLLEGSLSHAQKLPVEIMAGTKNYWYQHVVSGTFSQDTRFGFFNVSTLHIYYSPDKAGEIMSQSYLTYKLNGSFLLQAGSFYVSGPGFSPSLGAQFLKQPGDWFFLLVPRVDVKKNGSYDVMAIIQYRPKLSEQLRFFTYAQLMSNYTGKAHNRSYQNFRMGLERRNFQYGLGLNMDVYGKNYSLQYNPGVFIRTVIQ